ncbi:hypothetical protein SAMN04488078_10238 [Antarctobacter heliothermus]|uniref:Uncharacterized protein n=1 Tax=Antarctobacter heliothermus TaxID=74033 RepID=A0A239FY82_9RHOB|nr:hypothetical protein SAMN04488078_10238 [Antarctobacter heliothermus]
MAGVGILLAVAGVYMVQHNRPPFPKVDPKADPAAPLQGYSADNFCHEFLKVALENEDDRVVVVETADLTEMRDGFYERIRFFSDQRGDDDFELGFQARIQFYRILQNLAQPDLADNAREVLETQITDCRNRLAKLGVPKKPEPSALQQMHWDR